MPRKAGDGRGRLGGRQPGTPNKDKPLKTFLRQHSLDYFTPSVKDSKTGGLISQYDLDMQMLDPKDRVSAELQLLKFHTPQMQSTSVDMTVVDNNRTLVDRLSRLAEGEDISAPSDE